MFQMRTVKLMQRVLCFSVLAVGLVFSGPVYAQAGGTRSKEFSRTKFSDFYVGKKYKEAVKIYEESIRKYYPDLINSDPNLRYQYCDSLWQMAAKGPKKIMKKAEEELRAFVNDQPQFVAARFLYASVLAKQKRPETKDQLITAAQLGVPVLREIQNKKAKHFKYLLSQPKFILEVVKAASSGNAPIQRNFFLLPYNPDPEKGTDVIDGGGTGKVEKVKKKAEIEKKIEALFSEIRTAVDRSEYEGLLQKFKDLNGLINAYKEGADEAVKKQLKRFEDDYKDPRYERVRLALTLQSYISQGNRSIREMRVNLKRKEYEKVFQGFQSISTIVDQMRAFERPEYKQKADLLFFNAKSINDKAIKQKRIDELKLRITGIVLAPATSNSEGETGNKALINDKIYREGQAIVDVNGNFVAGLTVYRIVPGAVRFRYEDTTFVRSLETKKDDVK